jgi:predicted enzyme related to lactoylglutathione lyase
MPAGWKPDRLYYLIAAGEEPCRAKVRLGAQREQHEGDTVFTGAHVVLYSRDADADRRFIRDVLGFPHVDAGAGWLIFKLPPAEVAVHPGGGPPRHEFYLMCRDVDAALDAVAAHGVEVSRAVAEEPWGLLATIPLPSGAGLPLYQPRHPVAYDLDG